MQFVHGRSADSGEPASAARGVLVVEEDFAILLTIFKIQGG